MPAVFTYRLRRDTALHWTEVNPVLELAEPGYEQNTGFMKIGDGVTPWSALPYFVPYAGSAPGNPPTDEQLLEHINSLLPHPVYDDGPSLFLLYENAKV